MAFESFEGYSVYMTHRGAVGYRSAGIRLAVAAFAQEHLPRGKGAVPRWLGIVGGRKPRFLLTRHGARLVMSPNAWDVYATIHNQDGAWDYHDFETCVNGTQNPGVFYDIGANVGYFSVEMACRFTGSIEVVAFEPQVELAAAITQSMALNGIENSTVVQAMVGDAERTTDLYLAHATIHASSVPDSGRNTVATIPGRMVSIDDLVRSGAIPPPDMVKIDVEGSEHLVLRGAHSTFREYRPNIFIEYIEEFDPDFRVRREVEELLSDCPTIELFAHTAHKGHGNSPYAWLRVRSAVDWHASIDSLFLRNVERGVLDEREFEPK